MCAQGKRGRKKTPSRLLKLRGSRNANLRSGYPTVEPALPDCPAWLRERCGEQWQAVGEMLYAMGLMAAAFTPALALLSDALADWAALTKEAEITPFVSDGQYGTKPEPVHRMKGLAGDRLLKLLVQFGLTPSAIEGVKGVRQTEKEEGLDAVKLA